MNRTRIARAPTLLSRLAVPLAQGFAALALTLGVLFALGLLH